MSEPTPRPWTWSDGGNLRAAIDGYRVNSGMRSAEERNANRAYIVKCVNMHDGFLETCAKARGDLEAWVCQEEGGDEDLIARISDKASEVYDNLKELFDLLESILAEHAEVACKSARADIVSDVEFGTKKAFENLEAALAENAEAKT